MKWAETEILEARGAIFEFRKEKGVPKEKILGLVSSLAEVFTDEF